MKQVSSNGAQGGHVCLVNQDTAVSRPFSPDPAMAQKSRSKKTAGVSPTAVVLSRCLVGFFVCLVYLWHCITPFLIQPSPEIMHDLINSGLIKDTNNSLGVASSTAGSFITVENWTKWKLFVNSSSGLPQRIIEAMTKDSIPFSSSGLVFYAEWRAHYEFHLEEYVPEEDLSQATVGGGGGQLRYRLVAPPLTFETLGIFDHIRVTIVQDKDKGGQVKTRTVQVMPRFLFGLSKETTRVLYGNDEGTVGDRLPVVGVFGGSTMKDRIIIQATMLLIILSVIFLLVTHHPPSTMGPCGKRTAVISTTSRPAASSRDSKTNNGKADDVIIKKSQ